jgi:myo-inositol-1(or 4)-monophosphatase
VSEKGGPVKEFLETAIAAARAAGAVQKQRYCGDFAIEYKGETNLVTEVDLACEALIVETINNHHPGHDILAEENKYASLRSGFTWVIDPLDGTTNYAHGIPWFCVSIALEIENMVRVGVIYHPMMEQLFTVVKGEGAYLNGERLSVSHRAPLRQSLVATGFPYDRSADPDNNFENFFKFQVAARAVRRFGAAALDLAYVATGRLDGFWETKLHPWDVAAGALLVEEAGGAVTGYDGEQYDIRNHRIVASNGRIHQEMLTILVGGERWQ